MTSEHLRTVSAEFVAVTYRSMFRVPMRYLCGVGRGLRALFGAVLLLLLCAGCVTNTEGLVPEGPEISVAKVNEIAAQLPPHVAQSGLLQVGVNVPYAPNEFKDEDGNIVGFDVDLTNAVGRVLGVTPVFNQADFDKIIPAIQAGTYGPGHVVIHRHEGT